MQNIGVFGGTFNPFHNAELAIAKQALLQFKLARLLFVPNGSPPHKKEGVLDKELRYQLLCRGIAGEACFEVSRLEIDRPGLSWSIDTLRQLRLECGANQRFSFIIGEDNVAAFESYERRAEFFELARLLVAPRQLANSSGLLTDWKKRLPEAEIALIDLPASSASSSQIRNLIASGGDFKQLVPQGVYDLISQLGLYGFGGLAGAA